MKIVLWGMASPKFIEAVSLEVRKLAPEAALSVQIPEAARSVDYCGVQPEEFLRVGEGDIAQLSGIVSRMSKDDTVLVLDIWSLVLLPDFAGFLEGVFVFAKKLKSILFLLPDAWPGVWREHVGRVGFSDALALETLFERILKFSEAALNGVGSYILLRSPPPFDLAGVFSGQQQLLALKKLGLDRAPKTFFCERTSFCSCEQLAQFLSKCLAEVFRNRGGVAEWRQRVDADVVLVPERFLAEDNEWAALSKLVQIPMSWDGYCSQSQRQTSLLNVGGKENEKESEKQGICVVKPSAYVAWLFLLAILESDVSAAKSQSSKVSVEAAFVGS